MSCWANKQWSTSCGRKKPLSGPDITGVSVVRPKRTCGIEMTADSVTGGRLWGEEENEE